MLLLRLVNRMQAIERLGHDPACELEHLREVVERGHAEVRAKAAVPASAPADSSRGTPQSPASGYRDRYEVLRTLARGGMAQLDLARSRATGTQVVIKTLLPEYLSDSSTAVARFQRESELMEATRHPRIVPVLDHGVIDGRPYLVMEYMPGGSLSDALDTGALTQDEIRRALRGAAEALAFLHGEGWVHRDVKPANILLDEGKEARLSDFGLAKAAQPAGLTQLGEEMGTLEYAAPEQRRDPGAATSGADIYSLGVSIYEGLSGLLPQIDYRPLAEIAPGVGPELDELVRRCLNADPNARPTAEALATALA